MEWQVGLAVTAPLLEPAIASPATLHSAGKAGHCALILEPALMKRQALKRLMRGQGYGTILEAESATEALALIKAHPVEIVLTPWAPPGKAGVPLLQALQRRPGDRPGAGKVPAIVLLDEGLPQQQVIAAVKAGIAGRLPIPARAEQLSLILSGLAGNAR